MFSVKIFKVGKETGEQGRWTGKQRQGDKLKVKGGRMTDEQPGI